MSARLFGPQPTSLADMHFIWCTKHLVVLHGFIKKTRVTPDSDLAMARKRRKELER